MKTTFWGIFLNGRLQYAGLLPLAFKTQEQAFEYARGRYGYLKNRKDLKRPPYNWSAPKVRRIRASFELVEPKKRSQVIQKAAETQ